jgi:hypothetical protein
MRRLLAIALAAGLCPAALAAPQADLWPRWQAHDPGSKTTIDYSAYDSSLKKYVVVHHHGPNGVRYAQVNQADYDKLKAFIQHMEGVPIDDYNRDVQRAYWTNLYNAETLDLVLAHYPVDSIRDIDGGLFSSGPRDKKVLIVKGVKLSLNDIEQRILRPIWHDSLTHYGVNRAAISSPSLLSTAYTGANIDAKLRANARAYVNSPEGVTIKNGQVTVSKLYDWYQADFGGNVTGVISALRRYAAPKLSARLDALHHIDDYAYDWALNSKQNVEALQQP